MIKELIGQLLAEERRDSSSRPTATTNVMMSQAADEPENKPSVAEDSQNQPQEPDGDPAGSPQNEAAPTEQEMPVEPLQTVGDTEISVHAPDAPAPADAGGPPGDTPRAPEEPPQDSQAIPAPSEPDDTVEDVAPAVHEEDVPPPPDTPLIPEYEVQQAQIPETEMPLLTLDKGVEIQPLQAEFPDFQFDTPEQWGGEPDGELLSDSASDLGFEQALMERGSD